MKVISGSLKGRTIKGYNIDGTRPTMDRVKESLFAMIQGMIKNSIVLDLFAGSGNLGIEAISNGAKYCYFIDNNSIAIKTINTNIEGFKIKEFTNIQKNDYLKALNYFKNNNIKFDIVFLDPPYDLNCIDDIISFLENGDMININGIVVCELTTDNLKDEYNLLKRVKVKKYGEKYIIIFKNSL